MSKKKNCNVCGRPDCKGDKVVFVRPWGRTEAGTELLVCGVGVGVTDLLVKNKIAKIKKRASKKSKSSGGAARGTGRGKRPSKD